MLTTKRLQKEFRDIQTSDEFDKCKIKVELNHNNMTHWKVAMKGPNNTPYSDYEYLLDVVITSQYPFKPPKIKFATNIFHPNISPKGEICLDILKHNWSPTLTLGKVILSIYMLISCPNCDDPLNPTAASIYKSDKDKFDKIVKNTKPTVIVAETFHEN
jgi:ubiquitin-conjugating enzyme E2 D/E